MDRKVTVPVINGVKQMIEAGAKQKYIAKAFNVSIATIQNVKKTGFNYNSYNNLVSRQLNRWKLNKSNNIIKATKDNKTSINIEAITQDAKTDFILEKMAKLESNTNWLVDRIMRIFPEDK